MHEASSATPACKCRVIYARLPFCAIGSPAKCTRIIYIFRLQVNFDVAAVSPNNHLNNNNNNLTVDLFFSSQNFPAEFWQPLSFTALLSTFLWGKLRNFFFQRKHRFLFCFLIIIQRKRLHLPTYVFI